MSKQKQLETRIQFGIRYLPREPLKDHTNVNDCKAPDVCQARIVSLSREDLWRQVWIRPHYTRGKQSAFAWHLKHSGCTKINDLDYPI